MASTIELIRAEEKRQQATINLIASENYPSKKVREALSSLLSSKYSEGYPGRRYYGGNRFIDEIERKAIDLAKRAFKAPHASVQPYSGTPANLAVYGALLAPGETAMGMKLAAGGHLSHGHKITFSGQFWRFVQYGVDEATGLLDMKEIRRMAEIFKPKLMVIGASAYPRTLDFRGFYKIAKEVGAYAMADIAHIAGLIAAGLHPNPVPYYDVATTTTHKTLRGPRGAIIFCQKELAEKIDRAIFPGIQGGPHNNVTAAKAIALEEALKPSFKRYAKQMIANAQALAYELTRLGYVLTTGGTDNHIVLVDLRNQEISGGEAEKLLEKVGIIVNRNMIPGDPRKPLDPSGLRLGTPAMTTRGMKEKDFMMLARLIDETLRQQGQGAELTQIAARVKKLALSFPIP